MTISLFGSRCTHRPIPAFIVRPSRVSAALCRGYCVCSSVHEPVCHTDTALSDVLRLTPLITEVYRYTNSLMCIHATSPPREMNKISSVEKMTKALRQSLRNQLWSPFSWKPSKCLKCSFLFHCGEICRKRINWKHTSVTFEMTDEKVSVANMEAFPQKAYQNHKLLLSRHRKESSEILYWINLGF